MFLDEKTVLEIWLNPGLNLTMFRETGPRSENGCKKNMTFFHLKLGQDLENRAAHPHQEFPGEPPGGHSCLVHFVNIANYASLFTMELEKLPVNVTKSPFRVNKCLSSIISDVTNN